MYQIHIIVFISSNFVQLKFIIIFFNYLIDQHTVSAWCHFVHFISVYWTIPSLTSLVLQSTKKKWKFFFRFIPSLLIKAFWNAAAVVCLVLWADVLENSGEVWQGKAGEERNDGKRLHKRSENAKSLNIYHVNKNAGNQLVSARHFAYVNSAAVPQF